VKRPALLVSSMLALCLAGGCGPIGAPPRPDILLITVDTLRSDHLGCYGYPRDTSPHMDGLAREGALFETTYAPMSTTSPSHATLFTSRYPRAHRVVRNGLPLAEEETTLAELLGGAGYQTAAFVSAFPVSRRFGFDQGFETFDDEFDPERVTIGMEEWNYQKVEGGFDRRGGDTIRSLRRWLETADPQKSLFLWIHLFDPHGPYQPPKPFASRFRDPKHSPLEQYIALYDAEVLYTDDRIGALLELVRTHRPERARLTILTSDHGEGLNDHGWPAHNLSVFEEEVRVPLIFHWPQRLPAGRRIGQPAHLIDVAPTLLGLLRIPAGGAKLDGQDLSAFLLASPSVDAERPIFLQRPNFSEDREDLEPRQRGWGLGVRKGSWKLFEADGASYRELYDLSRDPRERRNLAHRNAAKVGELSQLIASWHREQEGKALDGELTVDPDVLEGLRALGYGEDTPGGEDPDDASTTP
jgi:arylsulfatase A-like enzyme